MNIDEFLNRCMDDINKKLEPMDIKNLFNLSKLCSVFCPEEGIFYLIISIVLSSTLKFEKEVSSLEMFNRAKISQVSEKYPVRLEAISKLVRYYQFNFDATSVEVAEACGNQKALHKLLWANFCLARTDITQSIPNDFFASGIIKKPRTTDKIPVHPEYDLLVDDLTICVPSNRIPFLKDWIKMVRGHVTRTTPISIAVESGRAKEISDFISELGYINITVSEGENWQSRLYFSLKSADTKSVFTIGDDDLFSPRILLLAQTALQKHPNLSAVTGAMVDIRNMGDVLDLRFRKQYSIKANIVSDRMMERELSQNNFVNMVHRRSHLLKIFEIAERYGLSHLMTEILLCLMIPCCGPVLSSDDVILTFRTRTTEGPFKAAGLTNGTVLREIAQAKNRNMIAQLHVAAMDFCTTMDMSVDEEEMLKWIVNEILVRSTQNSRIHTLQMIDVAELRDVSSFIKKSTMMRHSSDLKFGAHLFVHHQVHDTEVE